MTEAETQKQIGDWREDISEPKATLKIADGEVKFVTFRSEGELNVHQEFGKSIMFVVSEDADDEKRWYVSPQNYDLLGQIKALGKLSGMKVKIQRKGSKRTDTRYEIEKVE